MDKSNRIVYQISHVLTRPNEILEWSHCRCILSSFFDTSFFLSRRKRILFLVCIQREANFFEMSSSFNRRNGCLEHPIKKNSLDTAVWIYSLMTFNYNYSIENSYHTNIKINRDSHASAEVATPHSLISKPKKSKIFIFWNKSDINILWEFKIGGNFVEVSESAKSFELISDWSSRFYDHVLRNCQRA